MPTDKCAAQGHSCERCATSGEPQHHPLLQEDAQRVHPPPSRAGHPSSKSGTRAVEASESHTRPSAGRPCGLPSS
jgi:hypothetical protein